MDQRFIEARDVLACLLLAAAGVIAALLLERRFQQASARGTAGPKNAIVGPPRES